MSIEMNVSVFGYIKVKGSIGRREGEVEEVES